MSNHKTIIIVGGGFAGLKAAEFLFTRRSGDLSKNLKVVLYDPKADFDFTPLLPDSLLKNGLDKATLFPYRLLLPFKNLELRQEKAQGVDFDRQIVIGEKSSASYDYLIVAAGFRASMAIPGANNAYTFKTSADVEAIQRHINRLKNSTGLTINIIGGGATGVELSFSLAVQLKEQFTDKNYHLRVFHAADRPLNTLPLNIGQHVLKLMGKNKIQFIPNSKIEKIQVDGVICNQECFTGDINILTIGGAPNNDFIARRFLDERSFVAADEFLQIKNAANAFVAGDLAGTNLPKTAQAAGEQGVLAAKNILQKINNRPLSPIAFKEKGFIVTLLRKKAIGYIANFTVYGRWPFLLRHLVYLLELPGYKNRWRYLTRWLLD